MGSLDAFLADLDDLDDEDGAAVDEEEDGAHGEGDDDDDDDDDIDMMAEDGGAPPQVAGLLASQRMIQLMSHIELAIEADATGGGSSGGGADASEATDEDNDAEYSLIVNCNEMVIECDNEIEAIAKTIKDEYSIRFPELDSLIPNPLDYARVVL